MRCHFPQRDADWFLSSVMRKGLVVVACRGAGQSCVVGRMSEVFGSIDNAHGSSTWQVPPRLAPGHGWTIWWWFLRHRRLGIISSASNWKLYKNNEKNKKEEDEKEIVNGSEREREREGEAERAHRTTWNKWSKEINSPIKNNHSEFCWIMHELAVPRPGHRPQQQRRILEQNWTSRGVHICEKSARPRLHLASFPCFTHSIYLFLSPAPEHYLALYYLFA